jgi:hypothetical protein
MPKTDPVVPMVTIEVPAELLNLTFAVQHNPNCASEWLVRLPGKGGVIDMKQYGSFLVRHETSDILGFGKTLAQATRAAFKAREAHDRERAAQREASMRSRWPQAHSPLLKTGTTEPS